MYLEVPVKNLDLLLLVSFHENEIGSEELLQSKKL